MIIMKINIGTHKLTNQSGKSDLMWGTFVSEMDEMNDVIEVTDEVQNCMSTSYV